MIYLITQINKILLEIFAKLTIHQIYCVHPADVRHHNNRRFNLN